MLTIPADVEALLKTKSMIGENRPQWNVTVSASSSDFAIEDVREIVIEKQMYQAQVAQIVIDNKEGKYAPDRIGGDWEHVMWPNNTVTVTLGYASTEGNAQAFLGMIDTINMRHLTEAGAVMTVTCRDYYKRALDQLITEPSTAAGLDRTFSGEPCEDIFVTLATEAGWSTGDIYTEDTGITPAAVTFARESYADAFLWLSEIAGFEVVVPEDGTIRYQFASDRQPEVVDESVVLTGTAWTDLAKVQLVSDSERVRSASGGGGTLYVKDTDYEIEYGNPARVKRLAGGSIGDGNTVYVTYVYAAWQFVAGEDIIELGYTIDDDDMYPRVVVQGEGDDGLPIFYGRDTYLNPYWNLPTKKTLYVSAPDVATEAQCQTIGDRLATRSAQRARRCEFACPGNPWLQVGDCIQIVEGTSTVSEIYRIIGLEHRFDHGGFVTQIQTYYYGYTPAPA